MIFTLTEKEVEELRQLHRSERDGKKRDRIKAILMLFRGYTAVEIAEILLIDDNTITGWKHRYLNRKDGIEWLLNRCEGYQGKLSSAEEKQVAAYVQANLINDSKQP